ncbi:MAG: hypothetical protein C0392_04805 [Syntrophus sp. (in: bacteria)]|nr:hypothetical protein [Syntrophus sp. (in: bacteria)]
MMNPYKQGFKEDIMNRRWIIALFAFLLFFSIKPLYGAHGFGVIFDISGNAEIQGTDKTLLHLQKTKHLLYPVKVGDIIKTKANSKVLIISRRDSKGYEILSDSTAVVQEDSVKASQGIVNIKQGYYKPHDSMQQPKTGEGRPGATVIRGRRTSCIFLLSPVDTAIIDPLLTLAWENHCKGVKKYTVRIMSGTKLIISSETENTFFKIPEGILTYNENYDWFVTEDLKKNAVGGRFFLPEKNKVAEIRGQIKQYRQDKNDLSGRLSFLFFLLDNYLNDSADEEIAKLEKEFPENEYIKNLNQ